MGLDEEGYLSDDNELIRKDFEDRYNDYFTLAYDINKYCYKILWQLGINNKDAKQILSACLFVKVLNGFQAIVLLSRYGLCVESEMLLRTLIESFIILKNIISKDDFYGKYLLTDELRRKILMDIANKSNSLIFKDLKDNMNQEELKEIKQTIKEEKINKLNYEILARDVGLQDLYDSVYRLASIPIHSEPSILEKYCIYDKEKGIISFDPKPKGEEIPKILNTSGGIILMVLKSLTDLLGFDIKESFIVFEKRLQELSNKKDK